MTPSRRSSVRSRRRPTEHAMADRCKRRPGCERSCGKSRAGGTIDRYAGDELAFLLKRAGITLPAERMTEVAVEYESFRHQIALVNGACAAQDEPALFFVARLNDGGG